MKKEEAADRRNGMHMHAKHMEELKKTRKAAGEDSTVTVSSGNKAFDSSIKMGFSNLVNELKKRKVAEMQKIKEEKNSSVTADNTFINDSQTERLASNDVKEAPKCFDEDKPLSLSNNTTKKTSSIEKERSNDITQKDYDRRNLNALIEDGQTAHSHGINSPSFTSKVSISDSAQENNSSDSFEVINAELKARSHERKTSIVQEIVDSELLTPETKKFSKSDSPSIVGPWTCSKCTFLNKTRKWSEARCEMCNSKRPKSSNSFAQPCSEVITITIDD